MVTLERETIEELPEEIESIRKQVHELSEKEVRPASIKLDRMDPADIAKEDSPYMDVFRKMCKLGYHRALIPEEHGGLELPPLACYIILEEIGWGSLGIATGLGVDWVALVSTSLVARLTGSDVLVDEIIHPWVKDEGGKYHGCWPVTEPLHGSDWLLAPAHERPEEYGKGQVIAEKEGDEFVLNGPKALWPSAGATATHGLVHVVFPPEADMGRAGVCIVPLNQDGVTKGVPPDRLGFRDDPQAEVVFENVRIPEEYMFVQRDLYPIFVRALLSATSQGMNAFATGLTRAAFEEALNYAIEREQGGKRLVDLPTIRIKLHDMFEKWQASRIYGRKLADIVWGNIYKVQLDMPFPAAVTAQTLAKRNAFDVANTALEIHGAYGNTKEFLVEKLFRDARALLIEDGTPEVLGLAAINDFLGSHDITELYRVYGMR
jgi:alkylation response protein AidB-like acyl-CoA dehydrogenase